MENCYELRTVLKRNVLQKEIMLDELSFDFTKSIFVKEVLFFDIHSGNKILIINDSGENFLLPDLVKRSFDIKEKKILITNICHDLSLDRLIIEFTPLFSSA